MSAGKSAVAARSGVRPARARHLLVWLVLGLLTFGWVVLPGTAPAETDSGEPVTITGLESADSSLMVAVIARLMSGGAEEVTIDDRSEGTAALRREFIKGASDFVVSGVPFSDSERAELAAASREVISAPVQAVGLSLFGFAPALPVFPGRCAPTDEIEDPGCTFFDATRYTGPVRLTPAVLADLFYERSNIWTLDELKGSLDLPSDGSFLLSPINGPRPIVRNDGDASNLYLDRYLAATATESRQAVLKGIPGFDPAAPSTESWPNPLTPSRQGQDNVVAQISEGLDPGASSKSEGGSVGGASEWAVRVAFELNEQRPEAERTGLFRVQLRNAAGEWVEPTTASITAAVAAAGGDAMGGSVTAAPGAYPITWVNRLYAPATGLTAGQANAVATLIRLQVTLAQGELAEVMGDGLLPAAQVTEALTAADKIVASNCAAAKGTVVTVDSYGPFVPKVVGGLEKVTICRAAPSSESTEEQSEVAGEDELAAYDSGSYDDSYYSDSYSDSYADDASLVDAALTGTSAGASGAAGQGAAAAERVAARSNMPFGIPGASLSPLDRAMTLALGAGAFLLGRRAWLRRQAAV